MKILKFGGKSLANGQGIEQVIAIIAKKYLDGENIAVVVSARGNATDELLELLELAKNSKEYHTAFAKFIQYQSEGIAENLFLEEFNTIQKLLEGIHLLGDYSEKIKDQVVAFGEILAAKYVANIIQSKGLPARFVDARQVIVTDTNFGNAQPLELETKVKVEDVFGTYEGISIVTGFIAATIHGETTTLGRNGSNYTASILANHLNAEEFQNFTHVDGIFTANPDLVEDAKKIARLSFLEANELANFGATILHAKTILPLVEKSIPLRILNVFRPDSEGTLITAEPTNEGIKSLSVLDNVSLLNLEGRGLLGKTGVDARIFRVMAEQNISVSIISQGSSERGIGIVVATENASLALEGLKKEFESDFYTKDVHHISVDNNISVISIIGQDLSTFHKPYTALIRNKIVPILFNNTSTGKNISLVIKKADLKRAVNVIHGEIFGISKKINIAIFGHGTVGGTLIDQILSSAKSIEEKKGIKLNVFAVANSGKILLQSSGVKANWKEVIAQNGVSYSIDDILHFAKENHLENLIAVDNTASKNFVENYETLIENGFDVVSSNKIANTLPYTFYKSLRIALEKNQKNYLYETNVGAGLPLIDTIKLLHLSGENITKIKGVFSGSLSFIFNHFSSENRPFSEVLQEAIANGYTEPDPREDLCGNDVARKLLILARELDLQNEFEDIVVQNLIPQELREISADAFLKNLSSLNSYYEEIKLNQKLGNVLRYVGELSGDLQQDKGNLEVKLISVPESSALGQLKGSDSIFEIYTESYGERPIVIQGAGAGASVTARGVFGDILRIADKN